MSKKFNIHDWQAKQRQQLLTEEDSRFPGEDEAGMAPRQDLNLSPKDKKAVQVLVGEYSINRILNYIAVVVDRTGKHEESSMIQKLANHALMGSFDQEEVTEHHAGDYNPGFLKQTVSTFLDKLKKKTNEGKDYKTVEKIMEKHFSAKKEIDEMNVTVPNVSVTGTGMGHFGDAPKKKRK